MKILLFFLLIMNLFSQEKKMTTNDSAKKSEPVKIVAKDSTKSEKATDKLREGFKKREFGRFGDKRF